MHGRTFPDVVAAWLARDIENTDSAVHIDAAVRPSSPAMKSVVGRGDDQYIADKCSTSSSVQDAGMQVKLALHDFVDCASHAVQRNDLCRPLCTHPRDETQQLHVDV